MRAVAKGNRCPEHQLQAYVEGEGAMMLVSTSLNSVQQLLAAELLFAVGFVMLAGLVGVCYIMGAAIDRGWTLMKQAAHGYFTRPSETLPARSLHANTGASR